MKSKTEEDTVTTLTTTAISVKPAYDYHKPEWEFPAEGKIVTIGYHHLGHALMDTFGRRVHFWNAGAIRRKTDIPANASAIIVDERIKRDAQEYRLLNDCARSFGVPLITFAEENLDRELRHILRGADLSVDPDRIEPDPSSLTPAEPTAAPNDKWVPKRGEVREFFQQHINMDADKSAQAQRLRAMILEVHGYEMSERAAYQQVRAIHNGTTDDPNDAKTLAIDSQFDAGAIRVAAGQIQKEFATYAGVLGLKLNALVDKARQLDDTNHALATELAQERTASAALRARLGEFEALAAAVERIKHKK